MSTDRASEAWEQTWGNFCDCSRGWGGVLMNDLQNQGLTAWRPGVLYLIETSIVSDSVFTHSTKVEPGFCLRRRGVYHIYDSEIFLLQAEPIKPNRALAHDDHWYPSR